jgi:hypothetical protein
MQLFKSIQMINRERGRREVATVPQQDQDLKQDNFANLSDLSCEVDINSDDEQY